MRISKFIGPTAVLLSALASTPLSSWATDAHDYRPPERRRQAQDDFSWRKEIAPGRTVEIKNINGSVRAEAASGNEVEVTATKSGRRSDPSAVTIQVVQHADGVTICAMYPSDDLNRPNECTPGEGGHMNVHNNDVHVEFVVRVPRGVRFTGRTVNGGVEANSLGSSVEASTVNGSIHLNTAGYAEAKTVNGSITASLGSASWTEPLRFQTVNGSITLKLPAGTSTTLRAETVNGDITTDFPLTVQGRFSRRSLTGTIGGGGRELALKTVNGNISLRRAP